VFVHQKLYSVFVVTIWCAVVSLLKAMLKESHAVERKTNGDHFYFSDKYFVSLGPWMALVMWYGRRDVTLHSWITIYTCCCGKWRQSDRGFISGGGGGFGPCLRDHL
jgi:hypothetical protein